MRSKSLSRRAFASALVLAVTFVGTSLAFIPAALASGPTSLGVSGWQVYASTNTYTNPVASAQIHGDQGEYASPGASIPAENDTGWANCGPSSPTRYGVPICPNASTIGMAVTSILTSCWTSLNFTSFQALVSIPAGTTISQFSVNMKGADDGARVSLVNSLYPNGVTPSGGYIYLGGAQSTGDLSSYVVAGEVNRVVITQVDDCPVGNNLNSAQISLNGTVIPLATTTSSSVVDATTSSAWSGTEVSGATAYDTATVSGSSPTGTATYDFYTNGTCSGTAATSDTVTLSGGVVPKSTTTAALGAGSYSFEVAYSGDASNLASTGTCESFAVAGPTVTCTTNASIFNTGVNASGTGTLADGSTDANWQVAGPYDIAAPAEPAAPPSGASYTRAQVYENGAYYEDPAYTSSQYIGGSGVEADYYFKYSFVLDPTVNPSDFNLNMDFYADNQVAQAYVNGVAQLSAPQGGVTNDQYGGFIKGNAASTTLKSNWQTGTNTIVVDVLNGGGPYSFDAQMRSSASCSPTAPSITNIPGTSSNDPAIAGAGFMANVDGTNSDGVKSVTSDTPAVCSASGTNGLTITFLVVGTCTLTSHVAQGSVYLAADGAQQSFTVGQATPTVSVSGSASPTAGGDSTYTVNVAGAGSAPTPTGTVAVADGAGGTCSVTLAAGTGTCQIQEDNATTYNVTATYSGDANYASGTPGTTTETVALATPTVSVVGSPSATAGSEVTYTVNVAGAGSAPTPTGTVAVADGAGGSCTVSLSSGAGTCSILERNAVTYNVTATYSGDTNYVVGTPGTTTEVVAQAPLTITASSPTITYGATVPAITASYSGFVNGDNASTFGTAPTCSVTLPAHNPAGVYTTTCWGAAGANYAISYVAGTLTVAKAPLTITASSASVTYGATVPAITASYSGLVNNDSASSLTTAPTCSTTATSTSQVGNYPTSCLGAVDSNYTISYVNGNVALLIPGFAPGGGAFVLGDQTSAIGTSATFWGAQWAKVNSTSSGSSASSFKGFAVNTAAFACGAKWTTDPGNSASPPSGTLPPYMAVLVTSTYTKSGSQIAGNVTHIVIVKTGSGYAPDPGHAGTGTVVDQVC